MFKIFFISYAVFFISTFKKLSKTRGMTTFQKREINHVFEVMAIVFFLLIFVEIIISNYIENQFIYPALILINAMIIFVFRVKKREDSKTIIAMQENPFNLPHKKVIDFKKFIKNETKNDDGYYLFKTRHKKSDLTVNEVLFKKKLVDVEYKYSFLPELKKDADTSNLVYSKLIEYYNNEGLNYGLKQIAFDEKKEEFATRMELEFFITESYLKLIDKKIPIRISQLLQYCKELEYLDGYIYFLMSLSGRKVVPKGLLYTILHFKKGRIR